MLDRLIPRIEDQEETDRRYDGDEGEKQHGGQHQDPISLRPFPQVLHQCGTTSQDRTLFDESPQIVGQILGRSVTAVRFGCHRRQDDGLQVAGQCRIHVPQRFGASFQDLPQDRGSLLGIEGGLPREQLIEGDSQRINVGATIQSLPVPHRLLGTHVA